MTNKTTIICNGNQIQTALTQKVLKKKRNKTDHLCWLQNIKMTYVRNKTRNICLYPFRTLFCAFHSSYAAPSDIHVNGGFRIKVARIQRT